MSITQNKNVLAGMRPITLYEFDYAPGQTFRVAAWSNPVVFNGNTYEPFPIGDAEIGQSVTGEIPVWDITLSNVSQTIQSFFEYYVVEQTPGRQITIFESDLSDPSQAIVEPFTVQRCRTNATTASLSVSMFPFDIMAFEFPTEEATQDEFPGLMGIRGERYLP